MNHKKVLYILSFFIPFIISLFGLYIAKMVPFGTHNILSAGNHNDFIPYLYEYYDHIHDGGNIFFNNTFGLGYDYSTMVTYYFSDPTNLLILLFPRTMILGVINMLYVIKIGFSGLCMSIYLNYKKVNLKSNDKISYEESNKSKKDIIIGFKENSNSPIVSSLLKFDFINIACSSAFALATTMITIGSYFNYLSSIAIFPIVILGLDILIKEQNAKLFTLSFFISIICSIHISIISFVFVILYYFTRSFNNINDFLKITRLFIKSLIISCLLSGFITINTINGSFFKNDFSRVFPAPVFINPFNAINQLTTGAPISYYSLYGNKIDIAFGVSVLFFTILYFYSNNSSIIVRLKNLIIIILLYSGTYMTTLKYLFNGLSRNAGSYIHFGYLLSFLCISLCYESINNTTINNKHVLSAAITTAAILIVGLLLSDMFENTKIFITSFEFLFISFMILLIYTNKSLTRITMIMIISLLILTESIFSFTKSIRQVGNGYISRSIDSINTYQIYEMSRQIHKTEPNASIMHYQSKQDNLLPNIYEFSGYDYIITQDILNTNNQLLEDITNTFDNQSPVHTNIYKIRKKTTGLLYNSNINTYSYNSTHPFTSCNVFTNYYLKGKDVFYNTYFDYRFMESSDGEYYNTIVTPYSDGDTYISMRYIYNLGEVQSNEEYTNMFLKNDYSYFANEYNYEGAIFNSNNFISTLNKQKYYATIKDDLISNKKANINTNKGGFISTSLPKLKTYNYYVNNKKVNPFTIYDNNALIPIQQGSNEIIIRFNPKYILIGIITSIIGIFLYMSIITIEDKQYEKNV